MYIYNKEICPYADLIISAVEKELKSDVSNADISFGYFFLLHPHVRLSIRPSICTFPSRAPAPPAPAPPRDSGLQPPMPPRPQPPLPQASRPPPEVGRLPDPQPPLESPSPLWTDGNSSDGSIGDLHRQNETSFVVVAVIARWNRSWWGRITPYGWTDQRTE